MRQQGRQLVTLVSWDGRWFDWFKEGCGGLLRETNINHYHGEELRLCPDVRNLYLLIQGVGMLLMRG